MKKEDREMIEKIMATEKVGYAYMYPMDGGARKEHYISMTPENIANYIGTYMVEAESMVFTDIADNLELNTFGCFINTCTSRKLCMELQELLFPILIYYVCGDIFSFASNIFYKKFPCKSKHIMHLHMQAAELLIR